LTRRLSEREAAWRPALLLVRASRWDRMVGRVGVDGVCLVPSRSVVDAHHEVRVVDGVAVSCTCWPARRGRPCLHRAAAAVRLWSKETTLDFAALPLRALLPLLVASYLEPPAGRTEPGAEREEVPGRRTA
jgi:hypothetical protein